MSDVKIQIKIGQIEFSGEGGQDWVGKQLDKILEKAESLMKLSPPPPLKGGQGGPAKPMGADPSIGTKTLPAFLKEKSANSVQVKKFLATAVWLESKGANRIKTSDITKALRDSNQTRLKNPADCLNQNVSKGYCEKEGTEFFATEDGKNSL